ncbi:MAG: hypothetical protein Kow0029_14410 [Candidatus Rifleibacteriota bacterium]
MQSKPNSWEIMNKKKWYFILILGLFAANMLNAAPGVIKTGDIISIWVKGEPELTVERQVGPDGSIDYPLLGNIGVNNLKTGEASKLIAQMLEDGYLREPLVQVSIKSTKNRRREKKSPLAQAAPLSAGNSMPHPQSAVEPTGQTLVEVVDSTTRKGVGGVAMMLGNRIYQSNRLGQILLDDTSGRTIILADNYKIIHGELSDYLKPGNPPRIYLQKIRLPAEIVFHVLDAFTRQPLSGVEITLDSMKVSTNKNGIFRIKKLEKEFGELSLRKKGYKPHNMVVDFKGPEEQLILMVRNE